MKEFLDAYVPSKYPLIYKNAVARSLYDDLCNEITILNDESGNNLINISSDLRIKRRRFHLLNAEYENYDGYIKILSKLKETSNPQKLSLEFLVSYNDQNLVIPEEILTTEKTFSTKEIQQWKLKDDIVRLSI